MAANRPSIAIVGSTNLDLVVSVARAPGPGETVIATAFERGFGGKGANQAVMAARFEVEVAFIGAVGDDPFGEPMARNLRDAGLSIEGLAVVPGPSGTAQIWVEPDGTNRIVVIAGANGAVDRTAVAASIAGLPRLDVVVGQLEIPQAATSAAFEAAKARGAVTILNPAPAAELEPRLLAATDWLVPNEIEIAQLAGAAIEASDTSIAAFGRDAGRGLVVTLGAAGASLVLDGHMTLVPSPTVAAVDSTGAGDAFVGAFAVGLALGLESAVAVRLGVACAADSVTRAGAQASYPDRARVADLLGQAISQPSGPGTNASSSG
ncbi:MAG TPA: ribokinase [Candidatus Limnocylindrales bacterium]